MVVNRAHKTGGARGNIAAANARRGLTLKEFNEQTLHNPLYMSANMFERWLVKRFGASYLEPYQLYKDGGGI